MSAFDLVPFTHWQSQYRSEEFIMGSVTSHTGTKHSQSSNRKRNRKLKKNRPFRFGALVVLVVKTINEDHIGKSKSFTTHEIRQKLRRQGRNLKYLPSVMNWLYETNVIGLHRFEIPNTGTRFTKVYYTKKKIDYRPQTRTRKYLERYNLT